MFVHPATEFISGLSGGDYGRYTPLADYGTTIEMLSEAGIRTTYDIHNQYDRWADTVRERMRTEPY